MKVKNWQISLTIAFLALGLILSLQYRTQQIKVNDLSMQKTEDLLSLVKKLYEKRSELLQEVWDLRDQERIFEQDAAQGKTIAGEMEKDLVKLQIASGAVSIEGPGITITIPPKTDTHYYYYEDLAFLVNELMNVGAEAVAINDYRIINTTSIFEQSGTQNITIDGNVIENPIIIKTIGDPQALQNGISIAGGFIDRLRIEFNVSLQIKEERRISIPAARQTTKFIYAEDVDNQNKRPAN